MNTCKALKKDGKPCKAMPIEGGLCLFHCGKLNFVEIGRQGGRRNRHTQPDGDAAPLKPPRTAADVKNTLADLMADVKHGRIEVKVANSCAYIATSLLKAIETTDLEERIARLESSK